MGQSAQLSLLATVVLLCRPAVRLVAVCTAGGVAGDDRLLGCHPSGMVYASI